MTLLVDFMVMPRHISSIGRFAVQQTSSCCLDQPIKNTFS